jgi:hypothetical protein
MEFGSYFTENMLHIRYKANAVSYVQDDYRFFSENEFKIKNILSAQIFELF